MTVQIPDAPINVAIVANLDFFASSQGGIENYAIELVRRLNNSPVSVYCVGVLKSRREAKPNEYIVDDKHISNYLFLLKLFFVALRLRKSNINVIHAQRPDHLLPFIPVSKNRGMICTVHGPQQMAIIKNKGKLIGMVYSFLEQIAFCFSSKVIFVDKATAEEYISRHRMLKNKSIVLAPVVSSIFFEKIPRKQALSTIGLNENRKYLCFIGRLEHEKNVDLIVRAFSLVASELTDLDLIIAGEGSARNDILKLIDELDLKKRIIMTGMVSPEIVRNIMISSVALILASKWEGSPLVVREALATGLPVISTDVGDVSTLINEGINGYIVKDWDENSFATAIRKIYRWDETHRRDNVRYNDEESWVRQIISIYDASLREKL